MSRAQSAPHGRSLFPHLVSQCTWQCHCQGTLYVGPCACKPMPGPQLPTAVVPTATYGELHLGSYWVPICLCNLSTCPVKIPAKTVVSQVMPANQVPPVVLLRETSEESNSNPRKGWTLEALGLQGLGEWPKPKQEQDRELLLKWEHLFAHSDLDLGRTTLIKHKIEVTDQTPFKEHY